MNKFIGSAALAVVVAGLLSAMYAGPAEAKQGDRVRVSIGIKPGAAAAMRTAITKAGGRVVLELTEINAVTVDLPRPAFDALKRSPYAEFVELDVPRYPLGTTDISGAAPAAEGQTVPYGITMVQGDQVAYASAGNRTICIVDSGIDATHEDLSGNRLAGYNYTTSGTWNSDENSHGTHVAGTVAALNNAVGVIGVMPNAQVNLFIAKVFDASGSASSSVISKAMLGCKSKGRANVISMSLGGSSASRLEQRTATYLAGRNVLLIAAAGNAGDTSVSYPAGFTEVVSVAAIDSTQAKASFSQSNPDVEIAAPGVSVLSTVPPGLAAAGTLTVGSVPYPVIPMDGSPLASVTAPLADFGLGDAVNPGMDGTLCLIQRGNISFSEKVVNCQSSGGVGAVIYNNTAGDLLGTMGGVVTTIPSVGATQADGASMLSQVGQSATLDVFPSTDKYAEFNGTSMATPHVAAVATLVWSLHTNCTAAEIRASLNNSAVDLGAAGRDTGFGYGLVQAKAAHDRITSMGCGA